MLFICEFNRVKFGGSDKTVFVDLYVPDPTDYQTPGVYIFQISIVYNSPRVM